MGCTTSKHFADQPAQRTTQRETRVQEKQIKSVSLFATRSAYRGLMSGLRQSSGGQIVTVGHGRIGKGDCISSSTRTRC